MARIDFTMSPGCYVYGQDAYGKYAYGIVRCGPTSDRNTTAQRAAGGKDREAQDHGGHMIAHCLGGRNDETNLDAQNANVNQRGQRHIEQKVTELSNDPNNTVFMSVQNYCHPNSERPDVTMITVAVRDNTTGQVDVQEYSLQNASYAEQAQWDAIANEDAQIDSRQDEGVTAEQRALANEYAQVNDLDDGLGSGHTIFLDPDTAPITADSNGQQENDGQLSSQMSDGRTLEIGSSDQETDIDDGCLLGASNDLSGDTTIDDGASLDIESSSSDSVEMDDGATLDDSSISDDASTSDGMDGGNDGMDGGDDGMSE